MSDDKKAKDVLEELPTRPRLGERLLQRVGARRDDAPGAARRRKLFARLGLPDPYEPRAKESRGPGLGPVSLKLSERRRPAPHSRVKDPKATKPEGPGSFKPKGIPSKPSKPKAQSAAAAAKRAPPKAPIPDIDPAIQRKLDAQRGMQRQPEEKNVAAPPPPPVEGGPPSEAELAARSKRPKRKGGRFRMRRTSATGPTSRPVPPPPDETAPATETEAEPPKPPRAPARPAAGLDDLFGFANEGRMRIPRGDKKKEE